VLPALRAGDAARTAPSRKPRWRTWPAAVAGFVMAHWVLLAFLGSAVLLLIASATHDASLTYPLRAVALRDEELAHQQAEFERARDQRRFQTQTAAALIDLADWYLDVGQYAEAERAFREALDLDEHSVQASLGLVKATAFAESGQDQYDPEVVLRRLQFVLEQARLAAGDTQADGGGGACDARAVAWQGATAETAAGCDPHALLRLGEFFFGPDPDRARGYYEAALRARPGLAEARFGLASLAILEDDWATAIDALGHAVAVAPNNRRYLTSLAFAQAQAGAYAEAAAAYLRLLAIEDDAILPYLGLARMYLHLDDPATARAVLESYVVPDLADDDRFADAKNAGAWAFRAGGAWMHLADTPSKRGYAYLTVAAVVHLDGAERAAAGHVASARPHLAAGDGAAVLALVRAELGELRNRHGHRAGAIDEFDRRHLTPLAAAADPR